MVPTATTAARTRHRKAFGQMKLSARPFERRWHCKWRFQCYYLLSFLNDTYLYGSGFYYHDSSLLCSSFFSSLSSSSACKSGWNPGGPVHTIRETRGLALHTCTFFCDTITQENYNSILFYPVNVVHILWAHRVTLRAACTLRWSQKSQDFHHRQKLLSPPPMSHTHTGICPETCSASRCINCGISGRLNASFYPQVYAGVCFVAAQSQELSLLWWDHLLFPLRAQSCGIYAPYPTSVGWGYPVLLTHGPRAPLALSDYFTHNIYKLFFKLKSTYFPPKSG